jgi:hypothetical protein
LAGGACAIGRLPIARRMKKMGFHQGSGQCADKLAELVNKI